MKNTKTLSMVITLSMLLSSLPAIAMQPGATTTNEEQKQNSATRPTETNEEAIKKSHKNFSTMFNQFISKNWTNADTTTKIISGGSIGIGTLLTGYLAYKFAPGIIKALIPIVSLAGGLMYVNHMASKPANKEFATLFGSIQMKAVSAFESAKNWFGGLFSKKK